MIFASLTGWIAAFYGALYAYASADFTATGTLWVLGWPFLLLLSLATLLNLVLAGGLEGVVGSPSARINRVNRLLRSGPYCDDADTSSVEEALLLLPRWPLINACCAMVLAALVVLGMLSLEWWAAGSARNVGAMLIGGLIATLFYGNTNFALSDLLLAADRQSVRVLALRRGLDPYCGGTIPTWGRVTSSALPTILSIAVASRLATELHDSWGAQLSIITLGSGLSVALAVLQSLSLRNAARDLARAAARMTTEETAQLITGSSDAHIVEIARIFNVAARRFDDSLRRSAVRYEALFEGAGDAILLVDSASRQILQANRRAEVLTGRSAESLRQIPFEALFSSRPARESATAEPGRSIEVLRADGTVCPVDCALSFVSVGDDVVLQAILHDVSVREQVEAELRDTVERMGQLHYLAVKLGGTVEQIADHVAATLAELLDMSLVSVERFEGDEIHALVLRDAGRVQYGSRMSVLGTPCEQTRARTTPFVVHDVCRNYPDDVFLAERNIETYVGVPIIVDGGEVAGCVAVMDQRRRDLSTKDMDLISVFAQRLAQALEEREHAEARDLLVRRLTEQNTELRLTKERLIEADRLKNEFMGMMSHELRTPLNIFAGYSEMLLDLAREEPDLPLATQTNTFGRMIRATAVLANLVEDTLSVLRLEGAGVRVYTEPVSLSHLFDEICASDRFLGDPAGVAEQWWADGDLPLIISDRLKLRQIITNLVGNARKFTKTGSIAVRAARCGGQAISLVVEDTGCGIPRSDLPHVFDLYRQGDSGESRDGCGIGLYIVRRYCELLGGGIEVESTVGKGTLFTVTLPIRDGVVEGRSQPRRGDPAHVAEAP